MIYVRLVSVKRKPRAKLTQIKLKNARKNKRRCVRDTSGVKLKRLTSNASGRSSNDLMTTG